MRTNGDGQIVRLWLSFARGVHAERSRGWFARVIHADGPRGATALAARAGRVYGLLSFCFVLFFASSVPQIA